MNYNLIEFAKRCPDLTIIVRLADLIEVNKGLFEETKRELAQSLEASKPKNYLTRENVMEMLEVSPATLWRLENAALSSLWPLAANGVTDIPISLKSLNDETEKAKSVYIVYQSFWTELHLKGAVKDIWQV